MCFLLFISPTRNHTNRQGSPSNFPFSALPYSILKEGFNPSSPPPIKKNTHLAEAERNTTNNDPLHQGRPPKKKRSRARFESANRWVRRSKGHGTDNEDFPSEVLTWKPPNQRWKDEFFVENNKHHVLVQWWDQDYNKTCIIKLYIIYRVHSRWWWMTINDLYEVLNVQ